MCGLQATTMCWLRPTGNLLKESTLIERFVCLWAVNICTVTRTRSLRWKRFQGVLPASANAVDAGGTDPRVEKVGKLDLTVSNPHYLSIARSVVRRKSFSSV